MKVIILAPTPPPAGGIAGWTERMQNASLKNGWKVKVVDEKLIGGRQVFGNKNKKSFMTEIKRCLNIWGNLMKELKDDDAKVVHSCIPATTTAMMREYVCGIISKLYGRKFVIHYRCTIPNMVKSKMGLVMFRLLTNSSDLTFTLNNKSKIFAEENSKTNSILIPNFIEQREIKKENYRIISERINTILYVGGVIESKGCCDIIEVAKSFPDMKFKLVGNVENRILDLERTPNVILLGEKNKEDVRVEYENADVFMFVSFYEGEGFSNALAEAMSNGLPCIVSNWAANKDMIEDKGGIVIDVNDIEAMKNAINELDLNQSKRAKQGEWNINKVKSNYTDKIITNMYVDAYEKLLSI